MIMVNHLISNFNYDKKVGKILAMEVLRILNNTFEYLKNVLNLSGAIIISLMIDFECRFNVIYGNKNSNFN